MVNYASKHVPGAPLTDKRGVERMVGEYQRVERLSSEKESISRNSVDKVSLQEYTLPYAAHQIGFQQ